MLSLPRELSSSSSRAKGVCSRDHRKRRIGVTTVLRCLTDSEQWGIRAAVLEIQRSTATLSTRMRWEILWAKQFALVFNTRVRSFAIIRYSTEFRSLKYLHSWVLLDENLKPFTLGSRYEFLGLQRRNNNTGKCCILINRGWETRGNSAKQSDAERPCFH